MIHGSSLGTDTFKWRPISLKQKNALAPIKRCHEKGRLERSGHTLDRCFGPGHCLPNNWNALKQLSGPPTWSQTLFKTSAIGTASEILKKIQTLTKHDKTLRSVLQINCAVLRECNVGKKGLHGGVSIDMSSSKNELYVEFDRETVLKKCMGCCSPLVPMNVVQAKCTTAPDHNHMVGAFGPAPVLSRALQYAELC